MRVMIPLVGTRTRRVDTEVNDVLILIRQLARKGTDQADTLGWSQFVRKDHQHFSSEPGIPLTTGVLRCIPER